MQKAISDMEKDQVLQQYQYFVGTQDTGVKKTPLDTGISALRSGVKKTPLDTGISALRSGENFSL